jgi:LAO/AO transport system kinase
MAHYLDFEKPIAELEGKIEELRHLSGSSSLNIADEVAKLQQKVDRQLRQSYAKLGAWQKVQVARHPDRPHALDYVNKLVMDWTPLAGDRLFGEDQAIIGGIGRIDGRSCVVIGQERGHDTESRVKHNFGMARPEGYRKAQRLMKLAERFKLPLVALVDTAGAYPGIEAEARGQAEAIARCLELCVSIRVPFVAAVIGEGGSGGAIAIAAANRVLMLEHAVYSVISLDPLADARHRGRRRRGPQAHRAGPAQARGHRRDHSRAARRRASRARRCDRARRRGDRAQPARPRESRGRRPARQAAREIPRDGPQRPVVNSAEIAAIAAALRGGDRRALARAITLVESAREDHRRDAEALVESLLPAAGGAVRLGITGAPGVGKSTFIENFGLHLLTQDRRVAVLAIDPSSPVSGGSILGDKTRMETLSRDPRAFIRPSPAGGTLGGVARRTRECGLVCEAAGFDVVIVETVGVGQSETAVADMVDMFVLLLPPAGGDELQGIKKGIVELADLLIVNKADGDLLPAASRAAAEYKAAIHLLRPAHAGWIPPVLQVSALERLGLDAVWQAIEDFRKTLGAERLAARRARQAASWMWREIEAGLRSALLAAPQLESRVRQLESEVAQGLVSPPHAARTILQAFLGRRPGEA